MLRFCLAIGLISQSIAAQTEDDDDIFVLSPFEVTTDRDVGYLSTNSTSGTSLNTAMKDLPMSVQVVNRELISDLQASDLNEALSYSAGVFSSDNAASSALTRGGPIGNDKSISSASGGRFGNRLFIRGLATPYQNRNGFRNGGLVVTPNTSIALGGLLDSVNMERIEVVRGPNSLLYGVGVLTGIANVIAKTPLPEPRYEAGLTVGSYEQFRATADMTGPLLSRDSKAELNYRLAGAWETRGNYTDFSESDTEYWVGQLEFRPNSWFSVLFEYQSGYEEDRGIGGRWVLDEPGKNSEFRNEYDEPFNWARHQGEIEGLRPIIGASYDNTVNFIIDGATYLGQGWELADENFQGGGKSASRYRISGPDTYASRDEDNYLVDLTLTPIENLTISAGAFITSQETEELNVNLRTTTNSPAAILGEISRDDQFNSIYENNQLYGVRMPLEIQTFFDLETEIDQSTNPGDWILPNVTDDIKYMHYWWDKEIVRADSEQYRVRAVYNFEHSLFDSTVEHTFLAGFSYIKDDVDFPDGSVDDGNAKGKSDAYEVVDDNGNPVLDPNGNPVTADAEYNNVILSYPGGVPGLPSGVTQQDIRNQDALHYRSIANFDPIRLGDSRIVRAGDIYLNQVIEQQGAYFVYQGRFFNDRVNLVMGLREDRYNARQFTYDRVGIDENFLLEGALNSVLFTSRNSASGIPIPPGTPGIDEEATKEQVLAAIDSAGKGIPSSIQEEFDAWNPADHGGQLNPYGFSVAQNNNYATLIQNGTATGGYITNFYRSNIEGENSGYYGLANRGGNPGQTFGALPNTEFDIFEEDVTATSGTLGLSFALTDELSIYGVYSEGISPNTALRDGSGEIIPAEEAVNREFGGKFDFENTPIGRISGNFALFEIERSNAIWNMPIAPAPASWVDAGTSTKRSDGWNTPTYDPNLPTQYTISADYLLDYLSSSYGIARDKIDVIAQQGVGLVQQVDLDDLPADLSRREKQVLAREIAQTAIIPKEFANDLSSGSVYGGAVTTYSAGLPADGLDQMFEVKLYDTEIQDYVTKTITPFAALYGAFMDRVLDPVRNPLVSPYRPIDYRADRSTQPNPHNNEGIRNGALVAFDETITGYEFEVFWTPTRNLQFIFSYAHVEREADDDFAYSDYESIVGTEINGNIAPFGEIFLEYGWENAQYQLAWVDYEAYEALRDSSGDKVSLDELGDAVVEVIEGAAVDETISTDEFSSRNADGLISLLVDNEGNIIDRNNQPRPSDYTGTIRGLSLNFNPEDEFTARFKYSFDSDILDGFAINGGVKYIGPSATSVLFRSASPLNELTMTPEVAERYVLDLGASYSWDWDKVRFSLRLNVNNLLEDTYDVTVKTLSSPNPTTGESITRRTEKYYVPMTVRVGLSASF